MAEGLKLQNVLQSSFDSQSARAKSNRAALLELMTAMRAQEDAIHRGGGAKAAEAQHAKGRLTVRERLELLLDEGAEFLELGLWAAHGMYTEYGGAPGAGVVTGLGRVSGRLCMIIANDATVKAGAFFPMTAKKVLRAQTIALENRIPTLYLVDSSGVFLPLQEDVFPDTDDFGRVFRNNAVMSSLRHSADHSHHGHVRCRRRVSAGHDRHRADDRRLGLVPRRTVAGAGRHRAEDRSRGTGRRGHARRNLRHCRLQRAERSLCLARLRSLVEKMGERHSATVDAESLSAALHSTPAGDAPKYPAEDLYGLLNPAPGRKQCLRHARSDRPHRRSQRIR